MRKVKGLWTIGYLCLIVGVYSLVRADDPCDTVNHVTKYDWCSTATSKTCNKYPGTSNDCPASTITNVYAIWKCAADPNPKTAPHSLCVYETTGNPPVLAWYNCYELTKCTLYEQVVSEFPPIKVYYCDDSGLNPTYQPTNNTITVACAPGQPGGGGGD